MDRPSAGACKIAGLERLGQRPTSGCIAASRKPVLVGYDPRERDRAPVEFGLAAARLTGAPLLIASVQLGPRVLPGQAGVLTELGAVQHALGDPHLAAESQDRALAIYRHLGDRLGEAGAPNQLGSAQRSKDALTGERVEETGGVPDHDGEDMEFVAGPNAGHVTLDSIRAADNAGIGISTKNPLGLFGYSGGGNLAFRTAAALERRNRAVSVVLMLDSSRFLRPFRFPPEEAARLASEFLADEGIRKYASNQILQDKLVRRIGRYYDFLGGTQDDAPIAADIHLITAQESEEDHQDDRNRLVCSKSAWQQVTHGSLRVEPGVGDHGHMLHSPSLQQNAALISNCFRSYVAETRERA